MIHSFVDYTIYRLAKVDKEIKSLMEDYPSFKDNYYNTLQRFLANPTTRSNSVKQISKNIYSIRIALKGLRGTRSGLRSILFTIYKNKLYRLYR